MLIIFYLFIFMKVNQPKKNIQFHISFQSFPTSSLKIIVLFIYLVLNIFIYIFVLLFMFVKVNQSENKKKKVIQSDIVNNHMFVLDLCKYYKQIQIFSYLFMRNI